MRAHIYIRKSNEEKWNLIKDKSEWVNRLLEETGMTHQVETILAPANDFKPVDVVSPQPDANKGWAESTVKEPDDVARLLREKKVSIDLCKHGFAKGNCKRGCK